MRRLVLPLFLPLLFLTSCNQESAKPTQATETATTTPSAPDAAAISALAAEGNLVELVRVLDPMFKAGTISTDDALLLAEVRVAQVEIPKAVKILKTILASSPGATRASMGLAGIYESLGKQEVALEILLSAREAGGSDEQLALVIALAQGRLGYLEEAQKELELARAAGQDGADIDYNLALILVQQGNFPEARLIYERLLKEDPSRQAVRRELARTLFASGIEHAQEVRDLCNEVIEANGEDWRAWELLGDVEFMLPDFQAAKIYYTKALEFGSKEIGNNPPRVVQKYTEAALGLKAELEAAGLIPGDNGNVDKRSPPPLPTGYQERLRQEKLKAIQAAAEEAAKAAAEEAAKAAAEEDR
ncbi:MAG: tetratricopeptide (TPR) repeat protein [Planctomycetota bacterium]|jgi:tetratricopeptide (TPR) repeat protein